MVEQRCQIHSIAIGVMILCLGIPLLVMAGSPAINLEYSAEPLGDVLEKFSTMSGYDIVVNGRGRDTPVSGKIENLSLEEAVRNILKRLNSTIVWDEKNKIIMISLYDSSLDKRTGRPIPTSDGTRKSTQSHQNTFQPSNNRDVSDRYTDRRGAKISGAGKQFTQGTRTTEP